MQKIESRLTVFFEDPFWVGVYERIDHNRLEVCKIVFGPEPGSPEIYEFLKSNWRTLKFSPSVLSEENRSKRKNPKRIQREVNRQLAATGVGTKAQQALKQQHEENKEARKKRARKNKAEEAQRKYEMKRKKRKEKHKGR